MKPETLDHALAEAVARQLTNGYFMEFESRPVAFEAALMGFRLGTAASSAQLLAELAAAADSQPPREAERQVRALPDDLA